MWQDLGVAFALFLIIEGIVPFINPAGLRAVLQTINQLSDQQLRFAGFTSMLLGLLLLYIVH
jgi:uncharacterized protein YjeT (DUF2065 family)